MDPIEPTSLQPLVESGVLGLLVAVAVVGAWRAFGALWSSLRERDRELREAHRAYTEKLSTMHDALLDALRTANEESVRMREYLGQLIKDNAATRENLSAIAADLEALLDEKSETADYADERK